MKGLFVIYKECIYELLSDVILSNDGFDDHIVYAVSVIGTKLVYIGITEIMDVYRSLTEAKIAWDNNYD